MENATINHTHSLFMNQRPQCNHRQLDSLQGRPPLQDLRRRDVLDGHASHERGRRDRGDAEPSKEWLQRRWKRSSHTSTGRTRVTRPDRGSAVRPSQKLEWPREEAAVAPGPRLRARELQEMLAEI